MLCGEIQAECTGSNSQYTSPQNCVDVLSAKPFGDWDEVWMDSVVCRELHILLARIDPLVSENAKPDGSLCLIIHVIDSLSARRPNGGE